MQLQGKEKAAIVIQLQTALGVNADGQYGAKTRAALKQWATTYAAIKNANLLDRINLDDLNPPIYTVTPNQLKILAAKQCDVRGLFYKTSNAPTTSYQQFSDEINKWLSHYGMTHPLIVFHYLVQICHESDGFQSVEEYKNRDGSIPKHWHKYKGGPEAHGRSLIQTTHLSNYRRYFKHIGKKLPLSALVTDLEHIVRSSMFYWTQGSAWGNINKYALNNDFLSIVIAINGGFNGIDDRKNILMKLLKQWPDQPPEKLNISTHYCLKNSALQHTTNGKKIFKRLGRPCI